MRKVLTPATALSLFLFPAAAWAADPAPFPLTDLARCTMGEAQTLLEGACESEVKRTEGPTGTVLTTACGDFTVAAVYWQEGLVALRVQFSGLVTDEEAFGALGLEAPSEADGDDEEEDGSGRTAAYREGDGGVRVAAVFKKTPKAIFLSGLELWPNPALSEAWQREMEREEEGEEE
jgi:hypothetical protein